MPVTFGIAQVGLLAGQTGWLACASVRLLTLVAEAEDDKVEVVAIKGKCGAEGTVADMTTAEAGARLLTTAAEVEGGANMDVATAVDTSLLAGD